MNRCILFILIICAMLMLCSCGGGNSSAGSTIGTTVSLNTSIKNGSSPSASVVYSGGVLPTRAGIDFVLTSVSHANSGAMASDIGLISQQISYEYIGCSDSKYTTLVQLPPFQYFTSSTITAGGTLSLDGFPVWTAATAQYFMDNYLTSAFANPNELQFRVTVKFIGVEIKNGNPITVEGHGNLLLRNF